MVRGRGTERETVGSHERKRERDKLAGMPSQICSLCFFCSPPVLLTEWMIPRQAAPFCWCLWGCIFSPSLSLLAVLPLRLKLDVFLPHYLLRSSLTLSFQLFSSTHSDSCSLLLSPLSPLQLFSVALLTLGFTGV